MKRGTYCMLPLVLIAGTLAGVAKAPAESSDRTKLILKDGWLIQSSSQVRAKGEVLSTGQYQPKDWYQAAVPTTVLNALVQNKVYPDPYFGMNLRSIPGTQYPIGENFANFPMPSDSPFNVSWWFRREFQLPPDYQGKEIGRASCRERV